MQGRQLAWQSTPTTRHGNSTNRAVKLNVHTYLNITLVLSLIIFLFLLYYIWSCPTMIQDAVFSGLFLYKSALEFLVKHVMHNHI